MTCLVQRTNRFTELQAFLQTTSQILRKLRKKCHEHCPSQRQPQALEWQSHSDTLLLTHSPLLSCWPTSTLPLSESGTGTGRRAPTTPLPRAPTCHSARTRPRVTRSPKTTALVTGHAG